MEIFSFRIHSNLMQSLEALQHVQLPDPWQTDAIRAIKTGNDVVHWMERLGRPVTVIRHHQRPIPLEEFDIDSPARRMPDRIQGFSARRLAGARWAGLGPILVFCTSS